MGITKLELRHLRLDEPQLKRLPLRAIVGFAARCARRVQPLYRLPEGWPEGVNHRAALEESLCLAEGFANGASFSPIARAVGAVECARLAATGLDDGGRASAAAGAAGAASHAMELACEAINNLDLEVASRRGMGQWEWPVDATRLLGRVAEVVADLAVLATLGAAQESINSDEKSAAGVASATYVDYDRLLRLDLGAFPDEGEAVDCSPTGPLGPYVVRPLV